MIDPNAHDVFVLTQRLRPVVNQYEFTLGDGTPVCFVHQRRFKFKEDIRFYTDDSRSEEILRIKARQRFDPAARYDVTDGGGAKVGEIQKQFGSSLLRSTYLLYDASGREVATARERSRGVAIFRRVVGFVPYLGDVADWLPIPYHFEFLGTDGTSLGSHERVLWKFRDTYRIDVSADAGHVLDRRLVLALAVGMDALQAR